MAGVGENLLRPYAMTLSLTEMQSDFNEIMADLPQSITFEGTVYTALVTDITDADTLEMAGITEDQGFEVYISKDDFTTLPTSGDVITISGTQYRVISISDSACGLARTLICGGITE